jgi:hypothetical protein
VTSITLAQAFERIAGGEQPEGPLSEFVDAFFKLESDEARFSLIAEAPRPTGQKRLDALAGAMGEYMAKHFRLPRVPQWVSEPGRYLEHAWHVLIFNDGRARPLLSSDEGLREFLTFSSPAEFRSRNIFTDEAPLASHHYRRSAREHSLK